MARKLVAGLDDRYREVERIHRFVADEIRYVALEHGAAAVAPTAVERTLDVRYGDCKGKVALFLALARQVGIPAFPVLVSTGRNELDKLIGPSVGYFDHMIACARTDEGEVRHTLARLFGRGSQGLPQQTTCKLRHRAALLESSSSQRLVQPVVELELGPFHDVHYPSLMASGQPFPGNPVEGPIMM